MRNIGSPAPLAEIGMELAGEIILTLGEAFEIAYQMALKEKAEEDAFQFERQLSQSDADDATSQSSKASVNTV
nr:hypothetical protein BaRGS_000689 [Batillaria attramentaria]